MIACMIAGTASGTGKTTVALAIMAALRARGLAVQPFKCGPDFLDPGHHAALCGRACHSLDTWMLDAASNRQLFRDATADADAAIVEGMMGLFDGVGGCGEAGSSAEIAKLLGIPVVLVLDASRSARSIAAVVKGFETFDPTLTFAGVILNGVASETHYRLLVEAIASCSAIPVLGRMPHAGAIGIPERHLGLHAAEELDAWEERRAALQLLGTQHLDLDTLISRAAYREAPARAYLASSAPPVARFGVARDQAFSFYYEDNLDLLRRAGAELVSFSPLSDAHLPGDLDGIYLGGGYPELHAASLSENRSMLTEVQRFAASGRAVYAECGGMLYLGQSLTTLDGATYPMAGVLPLSFEMSAGLVKFGYVEVELAADCLLGPRGATLRGHSFHHSRALDAEPAAPAYSVRYSLSGKSELEGFRRGNLLASYIHLHFRSDPEIAGRLVHRASAARLERA